MCINTAIHNNHRLTWITLSQLFAMFLIVLSHSIPEDIETPSWMVAIMPYLQYAALTVFMWTSGYLASATKPLEKYGYAGYVKRRAIRLLIPYFAVSVLMLIPKFALSAYAHSEVSLNPLFVAKQLITPREGILPHLWFLPTLWLLSLALPIWTWVARRMTALLAVLFVLVSVQFAPTITNVACVDDILRYALWFFAGVVCVDRIQIVVYNAKVAIMMTIFSGGYLFVKLLGIGEQMLWPVFQLFCLINVLWFARFFSKPMESLCVKFGGYSFPIYILSLPIQNIVNIICVKFDINATFAWITMFISGIIIPYLMARIIYTIERKRKYRVLSVIIGM